MPPTRREQLSREWLLTDGWGGFAMGTTDGPHTRRYHGLFITSITPPVQRRVVLHSVFERLTVGQTTVDIGRQRFGDAFLEHPAPPTIQPEFATGVDGRGAFARWQWTISVGGYEVSLQRVLRFDPRAAGAALTYTLTTDAPTVRLEIRPLIPLRDFHALDHAPIDPPEAACEPDGFVLTRQDVRVRCSCTGASAILAPDWWYNLAYEIELDRGQDWREDVFSPGVFVLESAPAEFTLNLEVLDPATLRDAARDTRTEPPNPDSAHAALALAADAFLVHRVRPDRPDGRSIIAGYPWFSDWGRDAMISLPGLLLVAGRFDEAQSVLRTFAGAMRKGLIPNRFADEAGPPEYNTVDASLWFIHAVWMLNRAAGAAVPADLVDACRAIVRAYRSGTDFGIGPTQDGLMAAGNDRTQLTWMDAARDQVVFTPRHGKAVEINALWHHALRCLADLTPDVHERDELIERAGQVAIAFQMSFWWADRNCLHDCLSLQPVNVRSRVAPGQLRLVRPEQQDDASDVCATLDWQPDGRLRPNQIFAASLPYSPLTREQRLCVVNAVHESLHTPFGLRTLEPGHADYRGRYEGDLFQRDAAYHNGTVWPWLIGPYIEAFLRANDFSAPARLKARTFVEPLLGTLDGGDSGCIGQIAEVYDGDAPHRPSGCPAQAWSVAEVRRALVMIDEGPDAHRAVGFVTDE